MAAKVPVVQCSTALVIVLLVLNSVSYSVAVQPAKEYMRRKLFRLFETALLNDDDILWTLQDIYYNPDSKQSPEKVYLSVYISVDAIAYHPEDVMCYPDGGKSTEMPAFVYDDTSEKWFFYSQYELQQQIADDSGNASELANLMMQSGSTSVFYSFDPSFYSIMTTLSSSIAIYFPYNWDAM